MDDEPLLLELLVRDAQELGYDAQGASSGVEAWMVLSTEPIDILLSDIRMPEGDGVSLIKKIRESVEINPVVLMMSGFADVDRPLLMEYGALDILEKPFDFEKLKNALQRARSK